ncbi:hypothetical protein B0J11DRAFT_583688 [Dendryphion nanum]|uniref:F-box protein n=1 Tax=Dendryphion nanum TaxID=256645 RepID=A0A9P9IEL1_9PLEO|nr:hypothetical protein B0J11DRAFT_583688 [Dendryphion nanum]
MQSPPFPFLNLPPELRLMVYENLPSCSKRIQFVRSSDGSTSDSCKEESTLTLIDHSAPTSILTTCRLIYQEARLIIGKKARDLQFEVSDPNYGIVPRLEADQHALPTLVGNGSIIKASIEWAKRLVEADDSAEEKPVDFNQWVSEQGYDFEATLEASQYRLKGAQTSRKVEAQYLLRFVRKSGWALYYQRRQKYMQAIEVMVPIHGTESTDDFRAAVQNFSSSMRSPHDQSTFIILERFTLLTENPERRNELAEAMALGVAAIWPELWLGPFIPQVLCMSEDVKEGNCTYARFWKDREWL